MILTTANFRDVALWAVASDPKSNRHAIYTGDTWHYGWRCINQGIYLNGYEVDGWEVIGIIRSDGELDRLT